MAQSLSRVKRRIRTVQSTRKITNSMKLVSSVKLRKMGKIVEMQSFYFRAMQRVLNDAIFTNSVNSDVKYDTPLVHSFSNANNSLYVLVTSNMGLCGGYNNNVIKFFKEFYKIGDEVVIIGEKGLLNLSKEKDLIKETRFVHLSQDYSLESIHPLVSYLIDRYLTGKFKNINLIYTYYKNSISFIPKSLQILPIAVEPNEKYAYPPIYEPSKKEVVDAVIPQFLNTLIYSSIYSSFVSEESARRNAMDNADQNALDLIDELQLEYNKARQSAITQEITEVVNGSNAVK